MNLAGVLPWIHWRGLLILGLLAAGNVFCMACPFMLPRTLARRWLPQGRSWPRWLRSKWLAVGLLVLFLWAYEAFSLWDSPWWTAWIAMGYFAWRSGHRRLLSRGLFLQVSVPDRPIQFRAIADVAAGNQGPRSGSLRHRAGPRIASAAETGFPAANCTCSNRARTGNMDCTFCLDCIHACPHDNIGIPAGVPGRMRDEGGGMRDERGERRNEKDENEESLNYSCLIPHPSSFRDRPDLAALILVLVFGAFANAAGMVGPVRTWQQQLGAHLGNPCELWMTSLFYLVFLLGCPCCWSWGRRSGEPPLE